LKKDTNKVRAARLGLMVRYDRVTRVYTLTKIGNSNPIAQTKNPMWIGGYLTRVEKKNAKTEAERHAYIENSLNS